MNDMAAVPVTDTSAWEELIARAKADGNVVTQAQVCEVVEIDTDRFDQELDAVRKALADLGIRLDDEVDEAALAAELAAQAEREAAAHVAEVLADPLGGIDLADDEPPEGARRRLRLEEFQP